VVAEPPAALGRVGHRHAPGSKLVDYGVGNMLATVAGFRGGEVGTFRSLEAALAWLNRPGEWATPGVG
jgi:hypothetical protein